MERIMHMKSRSTARILILMFTVALIIPTLSACGGSGGGVSVPAAVSYGAVDGYVYVPYGAAREAGAAVGYRPAASAAVEASCGGADRTASTNTSGYFKISSLPAGTCTVSVSITGYAVKRYQMTVSSGSTVRMGGADGITMTPGGGGGSITVGANVAGGVVVLDGETTNVTIPAGLSYTFEYVEPGVHTVCVELSGYDPAAVQSVTVTEDGAASVEFVLSPAGNGAPVADAGGDAKWFAGTRYEHDGWDGETNIFTPHEIEYTLDGSASSDPDNDTLTYHWEQTGGPDVELTDAEASRPVFVPTQSGTYIFSLKVSDGYKESEPDSVSIEISRVSGKLAFTSSITQIGWEIYTIKADGTELERLTENIYYDAGPKWSPDGDRLLYTTNPSHDGATYYVATMNEDGSGVNVLPLEGGGQDWSPDGTKILYRQKYNTVYQIYRADPDGNNPEILTTDGGEKLVSRYSYDGTKIVMTQEFGYDNYEIVVMDADGGNQTRLTDDDKVHAYGLWLPDGRILYTTSDWLGDKDILYVMNADGTGTEEWPIPDNVGYIYTPVVTDDGNFIFYTGDDDYLHVMYADGSTDLSLGIWGTKVDYHPGP